MKAKTLVRKVHRLTGSTGLTKKNPRNRVKRLHLAQEMSTWKDRHREKRYPRTHEV